MKLFNTEERIKRTIHGVEFELSRFNNAHYRNKLKSVIKPFKREWDKGELSSKETDLIIAKAMTGTIVHGWDGWLVDGKEFKYTAEACEQLLADDDILSVKIVTITSDYEVFLSENQAETVKK